MKRLLLTIFLVAMLGCAVHIPPVLGPLPIIDRVLRSTVAISYYVGEGRGHICTGFVVSATRGRVLTARHCVADTPIVQVDGMDSIVIATTDSLALVSIPPMSKPPLEIRSDPPLIGESVQAFGYGWGDMYVLGRHIAAFSEDELDIALDGPLAPGMSGGPVVDNEGRVVGVNQASTEPPLISYICGQKEIRKFLDENNK
jgi:S1-C subfamily serine protease